MTSGSSPTPSHGRRKAFAGCAVALILFASLSYSAVLTKSAAYDEPLHLLAGWTHLYLHDFRIDFDNPPLPKYWAALIGFSEPLRINPRDPAWVAVPGDFYREWEVATNAIYHTPELDSIGMLNRARFMMLLAAVTLGIVTAIFAWRLAGMVAAVVAVGLLALDPNFLAHGTLVKNDVPMALMMTTVLFICWQIGRALTRKHATLLCVLTGMALATKFSAVLLGPMLVLLLGIRALLPAPWSVLGRQLPRWPAKLVAAAMLLIAVGVVSFVSIWASYFFRFNPSPDASVVLDLDGRLRELIYFRYEAAHPRPRPAPMDSTASLEGLRSVLSRRLATLTTAITETQSAATRVRASERYRAQMAGWIQQAETEREQIRALLESAPPADAELAVKLYQADVAAQASEYQLGLIPFTASQPDGGQTRFFRIARFLLDRRLLPAPWIHGLLVQYSHSESRTTFLLGELRDVGSWYYFPFAMLVKTPLATQLALLASFAAAIWFLRTNWSRRLEFVWPVACLLVPVVVYMTSAITSNLNIGIRHVLPVYPFLYIAAGIVSAIAIRHWRKPAVIALSLIGVMLLTETLLAYPNYIAYFNVAAGESRGGFRLLGDSNLDWGQDLPQLAAWQHQHPDTPLAICYFGTADPVAYDIKAVPLPPWPPPKELSDNFVMAVSATHLQGIHTSSFIGYQSLPASEVLGGTIYLYDRRVKR